MKFTKRPPRKGQDFAIARYVGESPCKFRLPYEVLHLRSSFRGFDFIVYHRFETLCFSTLGLAKSWIKDNQL